MANTFSTAGSGFGLIRRNPSERKPTLASQLTVPRNTTPAKAAGATNMELMKQQRATMMKRLLAVSSASLGISLAMSLVGAPMLSPLGLLSTAGFVYGAAPIFMGGKRS